MGWLHKLSTAQPRARQVDRVGSGEVPLAGPYDGPGIAPAPAGDDPKERVAVQLCVPGAISASKGMMLTGHPAARTVAVAGRSVPGNEGIVAFVPVAPGMDKAGSRGWLHGRPAGDKIRQHVLIVDEFSTAPTRKILKHKLLAADVPLLEAHDRGLETEPSA